MYYRIVSGKVSGPAPVIAVAIHQSQIFQSYEQTTMNIRTLIAFAFLFVAFPSQVFGVDKKFQLGFTLPLTGPFAEFGSAVQNALKLAQDDEASLFEQVHVILEDDQYNAKNALSAFQKLKDVDGAGLILVWGNEPALAVTPVAESSHFPLIAFGQTPAIAAGRQNVLCVLGPANNFGKPIAEYLGKQNVSSIQMILVDNTFYRLVAESVHSGISTRRIDSTAGKRECCDIAND